MAHNPANLVLIDRNGRKFVDIHLIHHDILLHPETADACLLWQSRRICTKHGDKISRCVHHTCGSGLGQIDHSHLEKKDPDVSILIVKIVAQPTGPACLQYSRIGC